MQQPERTRERILVVDDEEELRETMQLILGRDYDVATARDGVEAERLLEADSFACVITDERMPRLRGTELLKRIREKDPDIARIVLTAYNDPEAMLRAINEGEVLRFLMKPCNPVILRQEVAGALERRRLARENRRLLEELAARNHHLEETIKELNQARDRLIRAEKFALAGRLASGFAHDIKNYMTAVVGLAEMGKIGGGAGQDAARRLLDQAVHGIHELSFELMSLAEGRLPTYTLERRDLGEIVVAFLRDIQGSEMHRMRRLTTQIEGGVRCQLAPRRIWRLLWNLLQNAYQATEPDTEITFRVYGKESWGCLEVIDRGKGISAENLERMFEPFFSTRPDGTGLGLEICKVIAESHMGRLESESQLGKGTTIRFRLPLAQGGADGPGRNEPARA